MIWSEGEASRVPEFYAEHFITDYPNTDWGDGLGGVAKLAKQVRMDLPGYREHIEELIEADNEVVVRLTITGTHPRNGEEVSFRDVTMLTVEEAGLPVSLGSPVTYHCMQPGIVSIPGLSS